MHTSPPNTWKNIYVDTANIHQNDPKYLVKLDDFYNNCSIMQFNRYDHVYVATGFGDTNYYHFITAGEE